MKPTASAFAVAAFLTAGCLIGGHASAQSGQASNVEKLSTPVVSETSVPTSSNRWDSLPSMTAHRCLAEAIGTASDPRTGEPAGTSLDPQTGKPICPTSQSSTASNQPPER